MAKPQPYRTATSVPFEDPKGLANGIAVAETAGRRGARSNDLHHHQQFRLHELPWPTAVRFLVPAVRERFESKPSRVGSSVAWGPGSGGSRCGYRRNRDPRAVTEFDDTLAEVTASAFCRAWLPV